ncbi:MAG: SufD family Fe-S cluster assembly protein [Pseudomonadales bacterium]|nr:SufD family Fe-S cluster assembly protein [Pseudomonadales bacterium]MCP5184811.1 SufD family Fe-S cluster assembly protein [Pseudomonadales bacterium]
MSAIAAHAWLDVETAAELRALVEAPTAQARVRESWKYTPVLRGLNAVANVAATDSVVAGAPDGSLRVDVAPTASEMALLRERACACPPAAKLLLGARTIDRLNLDTSPASPLQLRALSPVRPLVVHIAPTVRATILDDVDGASAGWLLVCLDTAADLDFTRVRPSCPRDEWQQLQFDLADDAQLIARHYCRGAGLRRLDALVRLLGRNASATISGAWRVDAGDRLDQQWHVEHLAPGTRSEQRHHGIVADRGHTTFRGRIYIAPDCPGVEADLVNRNLLLDPGAVCNTKPELEILSDDVRCSHGATVGQLAAESLFYLASRGLDEATARTLLAAGFLNECIDGPGAETAAALLRTETDHD